MELPTGNGHPKKVMELRSVFAQLTGCPIKNLGALVLSHGHGLIWDRFHRAQFKRSNSVELRTSKIMFSGDGREGVNYTKHKGLSAHNS